MGDSRPAAPPRPSPARPPSHRPERERAPPPTRDKDEARTTEAPLSRSGGGLGRHGRGVRGEGGRWAASPCYDPPA